MLPWIMKRARISQAEALALIRDRGSWSPNGGRQWSVPPLLPPRIGARCVTLVVLVAFLVGCASAGVVYQYVSAGKLVRAEAAIRQMAVDEGWSDERLEILLANLHRKYREE